MADPEAKGPDGAGPDAFAPTALATNDPAASRKGATVRGRRGATPRSERPETVEAEPKDAGSLPLGEIVGERYKLVAHVGAGGQGEVWRAEDVVIAGHVVALKMLFARANGEGDRDMQLRELRMLASVSHPSVVQFKDHGWLGGRLWFVMPWYEGKDLERSLPLDRPEARRVFEQVAGGLAAVHAKGLRHQDIKPSNIFLAKIAGLEETLPILLDFGVAATDDEILVAGSPQYFAPELAAEWPTPSADVGPAADVFALALALRIALDPEGVPEVGAFDRASLDRRAKEPIAPPSGPGLAYLAPHFERWLAIDPSKRPTAAELVRELAVLTQPEEQRKERARTMRRVAPWVLGGAILASVGGYWGWQQVISARKAQAAETTERLEAEERAQAEAQRVEQLGSALDEALARADQSSQRTTEALGRLDEAEAAIASAQGNATQLRAARDRLHAALEEARTRAEEQQAALAEAQTAITQLGSELATARRQLAETRTERDTLTTERDRLRTLSEEQRSELEARRSDLEGLRTQLEAQRSQLETQRAELEGVRGQLEARQAELAARTSDLEAERSARAALAAQNASLTEERDQARAQARAAEAELARARASAASAGGGGSGSGSSAGAGGTGGGAGSTDTPTIPDTPTTAGARTVGSVTIRPRTEADDNPSGTTP
ncbi:MAG: protein kinase [Sandaracinaceae bacterium]|nr:protein kinase [Sandaracinaceae bacterium]